MCPYFVLYVPILPRARLSILVFCSYVMIVSVIFFLQVGGKAARSLIDQREQIGVITEDVMEIEVGYLFSL